ncbi:MAG: PilZ domain-containing protein [Gammaproteobacteria bacterium]|nr:PilZ domain-containing protein [Gammaproteobacteria bacterium]MDD9896361.1 PilZ domain-containing protein [Gammaproteobacteria bacterium]MDD9958160.1 PilZ domain-containing protein [Gammaproteobacteria bacterium]
MAGHGVLSLNITDDSVLYAAYMPFIKYGGIFIPTNKAYQIGNEVFMLLELMKEPEKIPVAGKVVWVTPPRAQGTRVRGIGIQFNDPQGIAKAKIENVLVGQLDSAASTHTM